MIAVVPYSEKWPKSNSTRELAERMDTLATDEWDRTLLVVERLALDGFTARMPYSRDLPQATQQRTQRDHPSPRCPRRLPRRNP